MSTVERELSKTEIEPGLLAEQGLGESRDLTGSLALASARVLNPKQLQAIPLLVTGMSRNETAATIGIHPDTLRLWDKDDVYAEALARQKAESYSENLQYAQSKLRTHLDLPEVKYQQGAAKIIVEYDAQRMRANSTATVTVILDKLQAALAGKDDDALLADYAVLDSGSEQGSLTAEAGADAAD